ncbi:MAG: hypothetical protein ABI472_11130 [Ginsengibacter sp.]
MTNETNGDNPLANVLEFYFEQSEKLSPIIKQGIDDWFTVYSKIWTEGMRLQSELIKKWTGNKESAVFSEQVKNFGATIIQTQRDVTTSLVDIGMKSGRSIAVASKKIKV